MRVLHIINELAGGGAEKMLVDLIPEQKRRGVDVELVVLRKINSQYEERLEQSCPVHYLSVGKGYYNPFYFFKLRAFVQKFDVVHAHLFPTQYWVALVSFFTKKKVHFVTTEHSTFNSRMGKRFLLPVEQIFYKRFNKIVAISVGTLNSIAGWLKISEKNKFTIIENGINISEYFKSQSYNKKDLGVNILDEDYLIAMVARFGESKDHKTLLNAIKLLPANYKLLLVGTGKTLIETKQYCFELGLNDRVHFLGFRNDVPSILTSVDVCVLSSNWEGFGLAAVEAMAAGTPFVASNVSGLNNIVKDAGMLFERGDERELAQVIQKIVTDVELQKIIKERQLERVKKYSIDQTAANYIKVYNELLKFSQ